MAKTQREEELLTEKQKATLWKLYNAGYEPEHLADRYGMTASEFEITLDVLRSANRKTQREEIDWAKRYAERLAAG